MNRVALAVAAVVAAGCDDSVPATLLDGPRVLAVIADPPTVSASGTSYLSLVAASDGAAVPPSTVRWRACAPGWLVVDPDRDCAGDYAQPLPVDASGHAVVDVAALAARFGAPLASGAGDDPCGRAVTPLTVVVEAEVGGARLVARKQLLVGASPPARSNPVIAYTSLQGDAVAAGATLEYRVFFATDSLDQVCEPDGDAPSRIEDVRVTLYTGAGATASELSFDATEDTSPLADPDAAVSGAVTVTLPEAPATVPLWLVAVDEGGGVAVRYEELRAE